MSKDTQERRASFRVAVRPGSGLQAALLMGEDVHQARASNLSANGIFFRPEDQRTAPKLSAGDSVAVELKYEGRDLALRGVVCYRRDGGYGVHFPRQDKDGYQNPREALARIAEALQRRTPPHNSALRLPGRSV